MNKRFKEHMPCLQQFKTDTLEDSALFVDSLRLSNKAINPNADKDTVTSATVLKEMLGEDNNNKSQDPTIGVHQINANCHDSFF